MQSNINLPDSVRELLDGHDLESKIGTVVLLVVSDGATPRIASLSVGELVVVDSRTILATLHEESRTSRALAAAHSGLLLLADDGGLLKIQVDAHRHAINDTRSMFRLDVITVERDTVPYARVTHGIGFELVGDQEQVLGRWRRQVDAMKARES